VKTPSEKKIKIGFLSFVGPDYSRSSTLLNFELPGIEKIYFHLPSGFLNSLRWIKANKSTLASFDVLLIMSPCQMLAPIAKFITGKIVILDAGWTLTDGVLSRGYTFKNLYRFPIVAALDLIAMHSSELIFVESLSQSKRLKRMFALPQKKMRVVYTGLDESQFDIGIRGMELESDLISALRQKLVEEKEKVIVLFRGKVNRESGFRNICEAAQILANEAVFIFILGGKDSFPEHLENVVRVSNISFNEMMKIYGLVDVTLGQISNHPRLRYTIPHKAFEAGFFKKPYVTANSSGVRELYDEKSAVFLTDNGPRSLADAILGLRDAHKRKLLVEGIGDRYKNSASQSVINQQFAQILREII